MISLKELSDLSNCEEARYNEKLKKAKDEELAKYEKVYQEAIYNLESKLKQAAISGKKEYTVVSLSAFGFGLSKNISDELYKKQKLSGNYFCAWRDNKITESDVIASMTGNLKRIYDYLLKNNLNPRVDYWTDGGGLDEGFSLIVAWQ